MLDAVLRQLETDADRALGRLKALLAIPSVSTDPAYQPHIARAAEWLVRQLRELGLDAHIHSTPGHPVVIGRTPGDAAPAGAPRVLFYGHYDVQPPDPVDKWESPPFEPTVRDGALHARGASDDKGQVCCFLEALRAWRAAHGGPPCHVTVMLEGEEECGSANLAPFMQAKADLLRADVAVICDTTMWDDTTVAITYGLRGLLYYDIQLHGPSRDLHSGVFGGAVANPANVLARVLGELMDDNHRVTVPGFYDDVLPVTDDEKARWSALGFDEAAYLRKVGIDQPHGEAGYSALERRWARPSCDVNGLYGGYSGEGAKTIIPSFAGAKVSFRLAANQDPAKIERAFEAWLHSRDTEGCRWKLTPHGQASPVIVPTDSAYIAAAQRAAAATSGKPPVLVREGGTIPVVADLKQVLGIDSLLIGFGRNDDRIHAPNEKFNLANFTLGCRTAAALLGELAGVRT